ncbi:hypothetical protein [Pantoea stewartii]|uniref:hypothetical protein n=1 Tax=Pantoea stewartii TaxID=66269 RepID=UPI00197FF100|nr:hypothetical protein [Pantoea stewartii]
MNKKNVVSLSLVLLCAILLIAGGLYSVKSQHAMFEFTCAANFQQRDLTRNYHLDASFVLTLRHSGEGMVSVDGTVYQAGNTYILRRNVEFQYSPYIQSLYKLDHYSVSRGLRDNVPENILNSHFAYLYISKIKGMDDAILVGSRVLPLIVCHTR